MEGKHGLRSVGERIKHGLLQETKENIGKMQYLSSRSTY